MDEIPSKNLMMQQRVLEERLYQVCKASFPYFSYKELKDLFRCQFYRLLTELRDEYSWKELCKRFDMTRPGLEKLGDTVPPKPDENVMRWLLLLLQLSNQRFLLVCQRIPV